MFVQLNGLTAPATARLRQPAKHKIQIRQKSSPDILLPVVSTDSYLIQSVLKCVLTTASGKIREYCSSVAKEKKIKRDTQANES